MHFGLIEFLFLAEGFVWWRLHLCWCSTFIQGFSSNLIGSSIQLTAVLASSVCLFQFPLLNNQVERGKQAYYCYDEAELKQLQRSFPPNASYNIQRFKGRMNNNNFMVLPISFRKECTRIPCLYTSAYLESGLCLFTLTPIRSLRSGPFCLALAASTACTTWHEK